jgi:hypothetical protein
MKILLSLLTTLTYSQTLTPTLSEPFSYPGSTVILTVTYTDSSSPAVIAGFQWTITLPPGVTLGTPVLGASAPAGATIACSNATCSCVGPTSPSTPFKPNAKVMTVPLILSASAPTGQFPQQIGIANIIASSTAGSAITVTAGLAAPLLIAPSTGTTPWFAVSIGQATCRASKVAQTPMRISWVCFNLYGANSGSYTADPNSGGSGADYFDIGINSFGLPSSTVPDAFLHCTIQVNATSSTITMLNGAVVPPNSAAYSCSGYSQSGATVLSWP